MSWLSTSLSENLTNITGQISTFTKDMLTEGTVEVHDHETELKIAKSRVRELELTLYTQREEYDRVKELNHELQERAEAAELQITSISREYRTLLQEKENEVVKLQEQLEMFKEHGSKQDKERTPSFNEESFIDGGSHEQWNKKDMHRELDQYQHELAALHTTYSQRIAALNKKHKQEIEVLDAGHHEDLAKIQELEELVAQLTTQNVSREDVPDCESDFEIIKKDSAQSELQALSNEATLMQNEHISELKILVDRLESENQDLKERFKGLEMQSGKYSSELIHLEKENIELKEELKQALNDLEVARHDSSEITQLQQVNKELTEQLRQASSGHEVAHNDSLEMARLKQMIKELTEQLGQASSGHEVTHNDSLEMARLRQMIKELTEQLGQASSGHEVAHNDSLEMARLRQMIKELTEQRDQALASEAQTSASLESLREELSRLGMVTMELMKEVEQSQGVENERSIEIESLKKLCQVRRVSEEGNSEEVLKLKGMLAVLWQKYSSVVLENQKVRLDVFNIKRRLLNQLQDRHGDTRALLEGVNEARTKLSSSLEGQRDEIRMEKNQLISMMPGVENQVEIHEESVSRLLQENDDNKSSTKDIVNEFGRRWSVSDHVTSLEAEKAVLERTIVGLEEKVQELERQLEHHDTSRSSVSTVVSVESVRALQHSVGTGENHVTEAEVLGTSYIDENDHNMDNKGCNEGYDNDYDRLLEKLREYEESTQEFELIKEDWEAEKEALENVVVELRRKLKEKQHVVQKQEIEEGIEKRFMNEIEELLVKKNYVSEEEIQQSANKEEVLLSRVLDCLRMREEPIIVKQEKDEFYSAVDEDFLAGNVENDVGKRDNELHATKNELKAAQHECDETKHELYETRHELDEKKHELAELSAKLNDTRTELEKSRENSRSDVEKTRLDVAEANERASDFESKLKSLRHEIDESQMNFNTTLSEKDCEIHKLKNVVEDLQNTLSDFENHKANVISELQQEIEVLQNKLGSATSSCETMTTQLEDSRQELALVLGAKESLGTQLSEISEEKEGLLGMVKERDARIEELEDLSESVQQNVSFLEEKETEKSRAFSELSEENSLLREEKADLFSLLETKQNELNSSLQKNEKLSDLLREQELASEEIKRQNSELAKDLESWRIHLEELRQTKEALSRDLDMKSEEILSLKENNIELTNQSFENSAEISEKLGMLEQLVSENLALKSENESLMQVLSQKKISEKELKDSYNSLVQEKSELDASFAKKCNEIDLEMRRKVDEIEILRLEVARLTKESHEKDQVIRAHVSANLVSGSRDDVTARQEQVRRMLQEKDIELDALRTKNESLLALFADSEQEKEKVAKTHEKQTTAMLEREERMLNELNEKSDQILSLEDRLEMLNFKSASKDQASALIHGEHQKLLHLNESQSEEIGRLREKVTNLGVLLSEQDHNPSGELVKLRQRNSDLELQVDALQGEQERLLMLVHDKDKQLSTSLESTFKRTQEILVSSSPPSIVQESPVMTNTEYLVNAAPHVAQNEDEMMKLAEENQQLTQEILSLRDNLASLNDSIQSERNRSGSLAEQNNVINQRLRSLEAAQEDSGNTLRKLHVDNEKLRYELSVKEREIFAEKEKVNRKVYEINTLQNEKDEQFLEQNSQVQDLQTKLSTLLDVISNDEGFKDEQFEILENREDFERLVTKVKGRRARLLSDKENEVNMLKKQVETLSSVQNISNPELERKLEEFMLEKDNLNKKILEIVNEKAEVLEAKESEMTSLQDQIVDLSNVLKQKERSWSAEKESLCEKNALLETRSRKLEEERDMLNESRKTSECVVSRLREELATLTSSADQKLDVVSLEKDRRVKDLERELEDLKQQHSQMLQEAQDMTSKLNSARALAAEFEAKKEKELERLRTHLLQVEDSYTQEALASEEREKELRHQLEQTSQQLLTNSHSLQDSNRTASMKMENLQEQLINVTAHRDEVQAQLEESQEQTLQYMRNLENLQMVLEQFQREKESELKTSQEKNQKQLSEAQREVMSLRERELELQNLLQNASDALNKADRLGEDLKCKDDEIENLKLTISNLDSDLQSSHDKLRKLTSNNDGKIEKGLMKNMLLAYFNTAEQKRSDVVAVLGHILAFTEEEIKKIGSGSHPPQATGWFSGLLSYSGSNTSQQQHDKTFSELFVSFLEKESEKNLNTQTDSQPSTSGLRPSSSKTLPSVTAVTTRQRDSPLPMSPLAASTPYSGVKPVTNALLTDKRTDNATNGSHVTRVESGNALLGPRPSFNLPTISNSSTSSTALRQILFNN